MKTKEEWEERERRRQRACEKPEKPGIWPRWANVLLAVLTLGLCWWLIYVFISALARGLEAL